jgi:hypothetical protein
MPQELIFDVVSSAEGGAIFYCIAIGQRAQNLFPQSSPPVALTFWHGQFDGGLASRSADDARRHKQTEPE